MNTNSVEINFHQQEQMSVYTESSAGSDQEKIGEIGLFSFYALRMLSNLGTNQTSDQLASMLAGAHEIVPLLASGQTTGGFDIVGYPGHPGRHSFIAALQWGGPSPRFNFKTKGFGLFAKGIGYYGPTSVMGLLRYLAIKRSSDSAFHDGLCNAAALCGNLHLNRKLGTSHSELGLMATTLGAEAMSKHADQDEAQQSSSHDANGYLATGDSIDLPSRLDRFKAVLDEFDEFVDDYQRDLAEQAIIWALAKLAGHKYADDVAGSYFLALVDSMYAATKNAQLSRSEDECSQLQSDSRERHSSLLPQIEPILRSSCQQLAKLDEDNILRTVADALHKVRTAFIDPAASDQLVSIIVRCSETCCALEGLESGKVSTAETTEQLTRLLKTTAILCQEVMERVENGELIVVNGKIVPP